MADPVWNKEVPKSNEFGSNFPVENQESLEYLEETLDLEHIFPGVIGPPQTAGQHRPGKVSVLFPGTTTEINALTGMSAGAMAFDTTLSVLKQYIGGAWTTIPLNAASTQGTYKKLVVTVTSETAATITADELCLKDVSNNYVTLSGVSLTLNTNLLGANGMDVGTIAAAKWYALYVIYDGTTVACLLSLSATAPTMPSGYIYKTQVAWLRTAATAILLKTIKRNNSVQYVNSGDGLPLMASGIAGNVTTPTYGAVALTSFVPTGASRIKGMVGAYPTSGTALVYVNPNNTYGAWDSTTNPPFIGLIFSPEKKQFDFVIESTNLYYASNNAYVQVYCLGWEDNI